MCLAIPGRLISTDGRDPLTRTGLVEFGGVRREVNLALVPEARAGDFLLVHAGVAITVLGLEQVEEIDAEYGRLEEGPR